MGFGGGMHSGIADLIRQIQSQQTPAGDAGPSNGATNPQTPGTGPGEPNNMNYGQGGIYNNLAQDMSRNVFGPWGFSGNQFQYSPYGNPYMQQPPGPGGSPPSPPGFPPPGPDGGGRGSWPGGGRGGMPGRHNNYYGGGYGGMYGGSGYGMSGGGYSRPYGGYGGAMPYGGGSGMLGMQASPPYMQHTMNGPGYMMQKPQMFPQQLPYGGATTQPVGSMNAIW